MSSRAKHHHAGRGVRERRPVRLDRLIFPDPRFATGYVVDLPGDSTARCDPVLVAVRCQPRDLRG